MKNSWEKIARTVIGLTMSFCLLFCSLAEAGTLTIPSNTRVIEAEAFYGDTSLGEVVLPNGIKEIKSKAYANSSLTKINLPASITSLADNAFENSSLSEVAAEYGTKGADWALANGIKLVSSSWPGFTMSGTIHSAGNSKAENGTDVTSELGSWFTVQDETGGWFKFTAPSTGSYTFSVKAPSITEAFYIRIYANHTGTISEIKKFRYEKNSSVVTYMLQNVSAGETIYWWDAKASNMGYTFKQPFQVLVDPVTSGSTPTPTSNIDNTPNPQHDDIIIPWFDGDGIRDVYVSDGCLTVEFDKFQSADGYYVYVKNTATDSTDKIYAGAEDNTANGVVTVSALFASELQDDTTYSITVVAIGDGKILSTECAPYEYTTDFSGSEEEIEYIYPNSITINMSEKEMRVGDYLDLAVSITPSDVSDEVSAITWGSYDESVAIIDDGEVYANGVGATAVYAKTENGLYAYCEIIVLPDPIITGNFENNNKSMIVKYGYADQLSYHVEVEYGKLKSIKLVQVTSQKRTTIYTNSHSGKKQADGYFTISAAPGGDFRSLGSRYTFELEAVLTDGTATVLDTVSAEIGFGVPEPVGNVNAYYDGEDICVSWTNNGDARWFRVMYYEPNNPQGIYGSVDANSEDANSVIIPADSIEEYKTYMIYVVAYPTDNASQYTSRSEPVRVTTVNSSTPAVTARFVGDQKVYAPGETIQIEITYENVCKVHYHNGDKGYNPTSWFNGDISGDIGGEDSNNSSGVQIVELEAQPTSGWYIVEINAKNKKGVQASHFYNFTTTENVDCLGLEYYVDDEGLDAPSWRTARSMTAIGDLFWSAVSNATGYRIWVSTTNDFSNARAIEVGDVRQYSLSGLITGRTYYIWVQAVNGSGGGALSVMKRLLLSSTSPTVSATIADKNNIPVGGTVQIDITYRNVCKVHYQNGTGSSGDIGDDTAEENFSGTETVYLPAQYKPGKYDVTIWAKDTEGKRATSDEGLKVSYTVTGEAPTPSVSLSICPDSANIVQAGAKERNTIWLSATYQNATKLEYTLHNQNNDDTPAYRFTTYGYLKTDPAMLSFPIPVPYSSTTQTEGMLFIPSDELETGEYTLRVIAYDDYGQESDPAEIRIEISDKRQKLLEEMRQRAEDAVNYEWIPSETIDVWNGNSYKGKQTFDKGQTVTGIPYTLFSDGQDTLAEYKIHAASNYTKSGYVANYGDRTGPAYGTCCATFVCEIFGGSFINKNGHPKGYNVGTVRNCGLTSKDVEAYKFEEGDAVSYDGHVIWISKIEGSQATIYECAASDGVCKSRTITLPDQGYLKYGGETYKIVTKSPELVNVE